MKRKMSHWAIRDKNQAGVEDILFWTQKRNFRFVTFILTNSRENKLSLREILQKFSKILWHTLEIPRSKTKTHGNSTWFFLEFRWKFHFCFYSPLEFPYFFFNILGNSIKFHLDFSGIAHFCSGMPTFFKLWFGVYHIYTMCTRFAKTWYLSASVMLQR